MNYVAYTAHLLHSPQSAQRSLAALQRALANQGEMLASETLAARVGLSSVLRQSMKGKLCLL